ncbi:MAG: DEAD/DEAH box helicase family protein [Magnetococcus sp. WYHC-3]
MIEIRFDEGTLRLSGPPELLAGVAAWVKWDERARVFRAEARHYGPILLTLHKGRVPFRDLARAFETRTFPPGSDPLPRPHQQAALEAWNRQQRQGVVVLPTGAGKSLVARVALRQVGRDALILVPTLELMHQWYEQLGRAFQLPIGLLGGGVHDPQPITVSTYDSAVIHMHRLGNRFGMLICDEAHHLPTPSTRLAAVMSMAPFRLGLTATPERSDGGEEELYALLGPLCYRTEITDLEGAYLAPYQLVSVPVVLDDDERLAYDTAYAHYRAFARASGVNFSRPDGWNHFIQVCARSREGRNAFAAYRLQKRLARASRAKLRQVWQILRSHAGEQALIFTDDNATAYAVGETFFLPVITHRTRVPERKRMLDAFRSGQLPALVTSRVLNEGVDVPDVALGIVVSGSGSVREHVQRLGRLLRPREGKQAVLYELISEDTAETFTSERRRQHSAYQR